MVFILPKYYFTLHEWCILFPAVYSYPILPPLPTYLQYPNRVCTISALSKPEFGELCYFDSRFWMSFCAT